jgi:hypothetical protein
LWRANVDYPLDASATLSGDFPTASTALLGGFFEAVPAPTVRIFRANQVMIVQ